MNFKELIFTYGPGSVGSVARALTRSYIAMRKRFGVSHEDALLMMIENRYPNGKAIIGSEALPKSKEEIVSECRGDLEQVILHIIEIENKAFREIVIKGHRYFVDVLNVVNKVIKKQLSRANF